jgi:hypothetical protein
VRYAQQSAVAVVLVAAFASAGAATAADSASRVAPSQPAEGCPDNRRGVRLHDGFFARSEPSLAFFRAVVSGPETAPHRTGIRGYGQAASISVGGTPAPGLVVGGTVWTARLDPQFVENGRTVSPDDDSVKISVVRLGPFLDFYPDPRGGFHVMAAAAVSAQVETDVKGNAVEPAALGAALSIGPGYEWFIMDQLSFGLLGRISLGRLVRTPSHGEQHILWIIPEIALTATYH